MKKLFTLFVLLFSFVGLANAQNMIENVYINGFTVPVWGELPDFDLEVPEGENYSIDFTVWYFYAGDDSNFLSPDHAFEDEGWTYSMSIGLQADGDASFSPTVNVYINNGQTLIANTVINDKSLVIETCNFSVANPATTISEIRVDGYTAPVMGEHPDFDLKIMPGEARYIIDDVSWLWRTDDEDDELTPEDVFDRDYGVYYMVVSFLANEGYAFSDNAQVYFNGDASVYNPEFSGTVGPVFYAYTIDYALGQGNTLSYGFEDGTLQDLQELDADGDGHSWKPVNGSGHKSNGFVTSESYDASTAMPLDPDNYLISPQVKLGGSIKFFACAEHEYYPNEHFGVAVSTTGTDPEDFTVIKEWTLTAKQGAWYECSADLSAYAGQTGYVAIRHYNSPDNYRLNIDDIQIVEGNGEVPAITEIRLNGFTAPAWGAHPDVELTVPSDAHYTINDIGWVYDGYLLNVDPSTVYDQEGKYYMYVELTPEEGYAFTGNATVYFNNDANICDAAYNEILDDGTFVTYTVDYELTNPVTTCTITASANPTAGGTATGGGTYEKGDICTLIATANEGYQFVNWTKNGSEVSTCTTYSFTVTGSGNYVANFVPTQTKLYTLTVQCNPAEGTVTGGGTYAAGTVVEVQAFPLKGYAFDRWNDGNTQNPRTITLNENVTLVAFFKNTGVGESGVTVLNVYPNPANDNLHIEGLEADAEVQFYNSLGMMVKTITANADEEINISDLAPGMYVIRCGQQMLRFVKTN
ncbi:MAG: choice-of-anchor J domain-containing protein [Bacteroidales bacterium]|nr:choice-of-anchor J domain-containing protein [Bacteroidales bacterium]